MKQRRKLISIVIPVLNEEKGLAMTIKEIPLNELKGMGYECEIIVVDGCSKDRSREVARKFGVKVVTEPHLGYGNAYKAGFRKAQGEIIVTFDADYTYPVYLLPLLINILEKKRLDFISTDRLHHNHNYMHPIHVVGNKILTLLVRLLFRLNIKDSQSGMWAFRRKILKSIDFFASDMAFSQELKIYAFKNFKSAEILIPYRKRIGKQKLNGVIDGFKNLFHLIGFYLSFNKIFYTHYITKVSKLNANIFGGGASTLSNGQETISLLDWLYKKQLT